MFAIISHNKNQYKVAEGKNVLIDFLNSKETKGKTITFSDVLLIGDDNKKTVVGQPTIKNASVKAEIIGDASDKKISVFKFHSKKRYQRNVGHKQKKTLIKVLQINNKNEK